jgi:hypothetical protein
MLRLAQITSIYYCIYNQQLLVAEKNTFQG